MATRHLDSKYREQENERNAEAMATRRLDPVHRTQDQVGNTAQKRLAREQPGVLEKEALQRRERYDMGTKFDISSGIYFYHQRHHGCAYIHLSRSTRSTKKKCCMDGLLSSGSLKFDEELMMRHVLDEFPVFMRKAMYSLEFSQECTTCIKIYC
jgi:hypothetical protein